MTVRLPHCNAWVSLSRQRGRANDGDRQAPSLMDGALCQGIQGVQGPNKRGTGWEQRDRGKKNGLVCGPGGGTESISRVRN